GGGRWGGPGSDQELRDEPGELHGGRIDEPVEFAGIDLANQAAKGFGDRRVRQAFRGAEADRTSLQDEIAPLAGPRGNLCDKTALADAGFAGDQHERRVASLGALQCLLEGDQLSPPADEDRTR